MDLFVFYKIINFLLRCVQERVGTDPSYLNTLSTD